MRSIDSNVPVIAFTAHAGRNYRERALQAGFNDVATKPVEDMGVFCQTVVDLAESHNFRNSQ
jgi:CheY-like chemotaxis protein